MEQGCRPGVGTRPPGGRSGFFVRKRPFASGERRPGVLRPPIRERPDAPSPVVKTATLDRGQLHAYIAVIASAVQLVEMCIKKFSPSLFRSLGIFLPLITTNCAILGLALFQTAKEYDFLQSVVYALGAGAGFTQALMLMAGLREKLELADVPAVSQGAAMSLMLAGLLSLAFMGFAGLGA